MIIIIFGLIPITRVYITQTKEDNIGHRDFVVFFFCRQVFVCVLFFTRLCADYNTEKRIRRLFVVAYSVEMDETYSGFIDGTSHANSPLQVPREHHI